MRGRRFAVRIAGIVVAALAMQDLLCHSPIAHGASPVAESRTRRVLLLTAATMVLEIHLGWWSGSMALLADGWHMGSHVLALGLSWGAYVMARVSRRVPLIVNQELPLNCHGNFRRSWQNPPSIPA